MSDIQGPDSPDAMGAATADPEAPYGRRPDGTPYKRDPSAFAHLRGKPFGSLNGKAGAAKPPTARGASKSAGKPRASVDGPLKHDAAGYGDKFRRGFQTLARMVARKAPVPGAIVYMRAPEMAAAWGQVAVSYPKFGRFVDRWGKTGDLSEAISSTATTLVMVAHSMGYTRGTFLEPLIDGAVHELLDQFSADAELQAKLGVSLTVPDGVPGAA